MDRRILGFLIVFAMQGSTIHGAEPAFAPIVDELVAKEMEKQKIVGISVGIIQNGKIAYLKAYGLAYREKKIPATTDSIFNWASNSKPLAAVLAMQLVEAKMLDLDADIRTYVPEFPDKGEKITTRHLLCHTSGIPHYTNGKIIPTKRDYASDKPFFDPINALDKFNQSPHIFKPGEKMSYSSYAYVLLSAVIQRAGKEPYDSQLRKRIAKPLEMSSLQLDVDFDNQKHWVVGYGQDIDNSINPAREEAHYWKFGAGGYKSNIRDFARWAQALITHKLVSADIEKQMWTPQKTSDGKTITYGLGMTVDLKKHQISHNGSQGETTTRLVIDPWAGSGIVVMTNCRHANPSAIANAISEVLKSQPVKD